MNYSKTVFLFLFIFLLIAVSYSGISQIVLNPENNYRKLRLQPEVEVLPYLTSEEKLQDCFQTFDYWNENDFWEEIGPITSSMYNTADVGRLSCIEIDPVNDSIILAGSPNGGLYYTLNKGNTWINAGLDRPKEVHGLDMLTPGIASILIIHENEKTFWIVATGDKDHTFSYSRGVIRSTDYGNSWHSLNGIEPDNLPGNWYYIRKLVKHPDNPNILFAATSRGVYKTTNALTENPNNVQWIKIIEDSVSNGEGFFDIEFHKTQSNTIIISKEYRELNSINGDEIIWSNDGGENWMPMPGLSDVLPVGNQFNYFLSLLELTQANSNIMYVYLKGRNTNNKKYVYYNDFWKYIFSENEWVHLNPIPYEAGNGRNGFAVSPVDENLVYCATVPTYVSTDGGYSWKYDNDSVLINGGIKLCPHIDIQEFRFNQDGTELWAASDGGPYLKALPDTNWINKVNNIGVAKILKFDQSEIDPDYYLFGGWDVGSQLFNKSQNLWTQKGVFPSDGFGCAFDDAETGTFYIANYAYDHNEISRFKNWNEQMSLNYGNFWNANIEVNPVNHKIVYLSLGDKIARSLDQGETWDILVTPDELGLTSENYILWDMHVAEGNGDYLYLTVFGIDNKVFSYIFKTINANSEPGSVEWMEITPEPTPAAWLSGIEVDYENPDKIWASFNIIDGSKIMEFDGEAWTDITGNLQSYSTGIHSIAYLNETNGALFAGSSVGIFYRPDTLSDWILYKPGLPNLVPVDIKINYNSGKIVTGLNGRGLWETDLPLGYMVPEPITNSFSNIKICPNPVNERLIVSGSIFKINGEKLIRIYNALGLKVEEIIVSEATESIILNVQGWEKGMYVMVIHNDKGVLGRCKFIRSL